MAEHKCIHQFFTWNDDEEVICAECGDLVSLIQEDDNAYFEILHLNEDGTYTAFHRSHADQVMLTFNYTNKNLH